MKLARLGKGEFRGNFKRKATFNKLEQAEEKPFKAETDMSKLLRNWNSEI